MVDYLYDGTFEGLMCCIYDHYYAEKASGIFRKEMYQQTILCGFHEVESDEEKALRVYNAINSKISPSDMERIYRVFLSESENKEIKILRYVILGFKEGAKIRLLHGNPIVFDVQQIERKVIGEVHRLAGLIRFSVLKGDVLYARIEPDHDVTELLADHFCDRFKNDPFIIHDEKRSKALIARGGDWYISDFDAKCLPQVTQEEERYRQMWRKYFGTIAIKERINPKCQKNFMPVRYWKNLTEKLL